MENVKWSDDMSFYTDIEDKGRRLFKKYSNNSGTISDDYMDIGGGRVVFDISDMSSKPSVLKIAHNQYGVSEIESENRVRRNIEKSLRQHLVPNVRSGRGWAVQPKCKEASNPKSHVDELQNMFEDTDAKDLSEIYSLNIGMWDGHPVIYDYGGIW